MGDRLDKLAFDMMEHAMADKTAVDLLGTKPRVDKEDVHNMLMVAGFTPGLGNIADAADAVLYASEGEFGAAGLSAAAIIPFIGQWVSAKRALRAAKKSGEEIVTVYRGVMDVDKHDIIKKGRYVSPKNLFGKDQQKEFLKYGMDLSKASEQLKRMGRTIGGQPTEVGVWVAKDSKTALYYAGKNVKGSPPGKLLEFEIPKKWLDKYTHATEANWIVGGIPRGFLKKTTDINK